jgi:hypothetical protein
MSVIQQIQEKVNEIGLKSRRIRGLIDVWNDGKVTVQGIEVELNSTIRTQIKDTATTLLAEIPILVSEIEALIP